MRKAIILKATMHNWGLVQAGDLRMVVWYVFRDGSFEMRSYHNHIFKGNETIDQEVDMMLNPKETVDRGTLSDTSFSRLNELINESPWRSPSVNPSGSVDGNAWEIESYNEDGSLDKTSGKPDYICGYRVLEDIVDLLPRDGIV